ncbi:PQQ-dependent sugar dehydrogenase [Paracoccus kondratievae]|uniref:PQQ-dependent sugar dehydrogenase n=1 Tax=Paracoccus TaxID=265 RepID=UPI000225F164|nr:MULTISPECIES: PQQ-dependent sugar dehydrogenase [Paracoccus]QFQ87879.1 PQQ-dependent sugar dehydrogenase [Paracoccus kondratievae]SMG32454.1 Glucose/arabinose dehydrogenase, beta-propeller fold [Paracoccus sp. J56]
MNTIRRTLAATLVLGLAAPAAMAELNDRPPNARDQSPAFPGQTRAPEIHQDIPIARSTLIRGLDSPWGMALLPDGGLLITERSGGMRLFRDGKLSDPIKGLPAVDARGQGGLLDVAVAPDFSRTRQVWFSFSEPRGEGRNSTSVGTGKLSADGKALEGVRVIFRQEPAWASTLHFGSRLIFDQQGQLFVTTGERSLPEPRKLAQDPHTHLGKVLRINPASGGPAPGNPPAQGDTRPEIWSLGHRNLQAAALDAQGRLWTVEHGPRGGDELNRPQPGRNYGWPIITYGQDYSGAPIGQGITQREGMEQPVYYWDPVIAPSGMVFYQGTMFPELRGDALIGGLQAQAVVRLRITGDRVSGEQRLVEGIGRVRDIEVAPDGAILILTDGGALIRLARG